MMLQWWNESEVMNIRWRLSKINQVDDSDGDSAELGMIWVLNAQLAGTC